MEAKLDSRERELVNVEKKLGNERDEASTKLQQLSETHEVLLSEMASVHSDLATANSQANTHKLASEKVRVKINKPQWFFPSSLAKSAND